VSAELVQSVEMLKQKFEIKGRYLKAPGQRVYLSLKVSGLPGSSGEMLQVSDGVTLWDFQQVLESKYYRKVTLGPVLEKLKAPELDAAAREQVIAQLGIAGPEVLLVGLRKAVHFEQKEEKTIDGRPVWVLHGTWQDRQGLLGPNQQPLPENAALPAYIPSQATVYVGKDDGWPYKVRLAGRRASVLEDTRRIGPDGRRMGSLSSIQKIEPSIIEMNYTNVTLDPKLTGNEFNFPLPPNVRPDDITESLLNGMEQMILQMIAQKKAETARAEPLLNQSITIPKSAPHDGATSPTPPPLSKPR
jgi:outer membrane lipoprotein-sorting protein